MLSIPVILGSTRRERQSVKVARYVVARLRRREAVATELVDLEELALPIMEERLRFRDDPPPGAEGLSRALDAAHAIVLVSPEYNHGYPGVLKNALDYFLPEYARKPFGIVTVSAGGHGGVRALEQLRLVVLGLGGFPIPGFVAVSKVQDAFADDGSPREASHEKRFDAFVDELCWYADAIRAKKRTDGSDGL